MAEKLTLAQKLLKIQQSVDSVIKDGKNTNDKYDFASDENVLDTFRPLMDEQNLLLIPSVASAKVTEGTTRSGTSRYFTELFMTMRWVDAETGESMEIPWYAQGVDLAGEKGVGKAQTYGEKYFLLKFFHVGTKKDDPDNGANRTKSGELRQSGTAAAKETAEYYRKALRQIVSAICGDDAEKEKVCYLSWTKSDARGYAGVDSLSAISDAALPVVYAKGKKQYETRLKKPFELVQEEE